MEWYGPVDYVTVTWRLGYVDGSVVQDRLLHSLDWQSPCTAIDAGDLLAVRDVQRDRERVYIQEEILYPGHVFWS